MTKIFVNYMYMYYISIRIIYKLTSACSDKYRIEFEIDKKKKN